MSAATSLRISRRRRGVDVGFGAVCSLGMGVALVALVAVVADVVSDSLPVLGPAFLTGLPSRVPADAGIGPALVGSLWLLVVTALLSLPLATGAALWLEEYAPDRWTTRVIEGNVHHLAHVPSVVYGVLGLTLFVRTISLGRSVLAGALTLTIFVLPILILSAQEALRGVPDELRDAARSVGATRWQVVRRQVLPVAFPDILAAALLALARVVGETAPLLLVGTLGFVAFAPTAPTDALTALPIQIFDWVRRPQPEFQALAAGAIVVLFGIIVALQLLATLVRAVGRRREGWL